MEGGNHVEINSNSFYVKIHAEKLPDGFSHANQLVEIINGEDAMVQIIEVVDMFNLGHVVNKDEVNLFCGANRIDNDN
jgi:hypothetical protein